MKKSTLSLFSLCAVVFIGSVFFSMNCAGPGTMSGGVDVNISDQPIWD